MGKTLRRSSNIAKIVGEWTEYTRDGDDEGLLGTSNRSDKRQKISRGINIDYEYGIYYEDRDKWLTLVGGCD